MTMRHTRIFVGIVVLALLGVTGGVVSHLAAAGDPLVRTVALESLPRAIAVDSATGRAFVVNAGDDTVSVLDTRQPGVLRTVRLSAEATAYYSWSALPGGTTARVAGGPGGGGTRFGGSGGVPQMSST